VQESAEQVASMHSASVILADDGRPGWRFWRLQHERPVATVAVVVPDADAKDLRQMAAPNEQQPVQALGAPSAPSVPRGRWTTLSTTPDPAAGQRVVRVTHRFHPRFGQEFVFVAVRQTWGEDRVFFLEDDGTLCSLPVGWTDAAAPDVFVAVAAGRCPFRVEDLVALAGLIEQARVDPDGDV
jgi:hypothetical protein